MGAGASARRQHERRKAKREAGVRERHPRLGAVMLALRDTPQHERSWARGAGGEELVEQALTERCPDVAILHDRRIPGSRANIDHIAVAATGVWVIDTKRYEGKVQISKPFARQTDAEDRRPRQTKLVDGLATQVELVTAAIADLDPHLPIRGCFCFIDSELPLFGTPSINGLTIFGRKGLAKQLNATGALPADRAAELAAALAQRFPSA